MSDCCLKGFKWDGAPVGEEKRVGEAQAYVTGSNQEVAIILIHDLFGWKFPNLRLLADHYAEEVKATVYLPDFFGGEQLPAERLLDLSQWAALDVPAFVSRNTKAIREPEILAFAKHLRAKYTKVGAIGFCYGGWAVFRLGAKGNNLVDCISTAHPSWLTKEEVENVDVPVQIIAPEFDGQLTQELKDFCNRTIPALGLSYDYQYFPRVEHAFASRGDQAIEFERKSMERAKNVAVNWFQLWLH